jgi:hypothetical protein
MIALLLVALIARHGQCALEDHGKQVYIVTTSKTTSYSYQVRSFVDGKAQPRIWKGVVRPGQRKLAGKKGNRGKWTFKVDTCQKVAAAH